LTRASSGTRFDNDLKYVGQAGPFRVELENALRRAGRQQRAEGGARRRASTTTPGRWSSAAPTTTAAWPPGLNYNGDDLLPGRRGIQARRPEGLGRLDVRIHQEPGRHRIQETRNSFGGVSYRFNPQVSVTAGYYLTSANDDPAHHRGLTVAEIDYSLSKRTVLYAEFDYTQVTARAAIGTLNTVGVPDQSACTFGINHRF
jgi:predicted porin